MAAKQAGERARRETLGDHGRALGEAIASLPRLTVAHGESDFLRDEALRRFRDAWLAKHPGGDLVSIRGGDGQSSGLAEPLSELAGGSLFGGDKLVLIRQAGKLLFPARNSSGEGTADMGGREGRFLAAVENLGPRLWLFLDCASLPRNRILGKRLAAAAFLLPCPIPAQREIPAWLEARAAELGKSVEPAAADLLLRAHGPNLGVLAGELEKMAIHAGDAPAIDAAAAASFLTGSVEFDIFGFANAVESGNRGQAALFARRIANQGTRDQRGKREGAEGSAHKVLSMLAGTLGHLLRARVALARRATPAAFAAEEGLPPFRAGRLLEAASGFELAALRRMLFRAAEEMRRLHDTGGDPLLSLETLAVVLTER